jgi:hypothetical protein
VHSTRKETGASYAWRKRRESIAKCTVRMSAWAYTFESLLDTSIITEIYSVLANSPGDSSKNHLDASKSLFSKFFRTLEQYGCLYGLLKCHVILLSTGRCLWIIHTNFRSTSVFRSSNTSRYQISGERFQARIGKESTHSGKVSEDSQT